MAGCDRLKSALYKLFGENKLMSCDIHCHAEVKIDGTWHHYSEITIDRNYKIFAFLAGVRAEVDEKAAFPVRGLPEDISRVTQLTYKDWECDAHTESWIGATEIERVIRTFPDVITRRSRGYSASIFLFRNYYEEFIRDREEFPKELQDVRWVFWFDN